MLRRSFLGSLLSALGAPAIVRASSLMPVKKVITSPAYVGVAYPKICDRNLVWLNGVARWLRTDDPRMAEAVWRYPLQKEMSGTVNMTDAFRVGATTVDDVRAKLGLIHPGVPRFGDEIITISLPRVKMI